MSCLIINLEEGMPLVDKAKSRLSFGIRQAKAQRSSCVKIIHGYGSSGKGGAIKSEVRRELERMSRSGTIRAFVGGENFGPFDAAARRVIDLCPELSKDRDYTRSNPGISIVVL